MENLKVEWMENKTAKTGRPYKKINVQNEKGEKFDVNIFSSFPDFANVMPGSVIRGKLVQEGQYWNIAYESQEKRSISQNQAFKGKIIEEAQTRKNEFIGKTLDRKEEAIKLMAAQRDAVLIVTQMMAHDSKLHPNIPFNSDQIRENIIAWRNWFLLDEEYNNPSPF